MPELPEVETTCRGIAPHIEGYRISHVTVRNRNLRWPVPVGLAKTLTGQQVITVGRRAKYLLITCTTGTLLVHLGMSGSLRLTSHDATLLKHDHIELLFDNGTCLRYCDPRRFGAWLWTSRPPAEHPLLNQLGPEPLEREFSGKHLQDACIKRKQAIKLAIMDSHIVVGVGNIYANEALFLAGLHPERQANTLTKPEYHLLAKRIKQVLAKAIKQGGTTLRDYIGGDGRPGYFSQQLLVYGKAGQPCSRCHSILQETRLGKRTTVFCNQCQT